MDNTNKKIETFAEDMAQVIGENRDGLIQKIIHEEEEHEAEKKQFSPESPRNKKFLLFGSIFLIAALGLLAVLVFNKDALIFEVAPRFNPIVFNEDYVFVNVEGFTKEEIAQNAFAILSDTEVEAGGLLGIYPAVGKKVLKLTNFLEQIEAEFLPTRDNFVKEDFMLGAYITKTKPPRPINGVPPRAEGDLFILMQARSFRDVFDDMRLWEERMFANLHDFFGVEVNTDTAHLLTKDFKDAIVQNKNARILYHDNGDIIFMYVYADESSVVITNSEEAVKEIILRLSGSRVQK